MSSQPDSAVCAAFGVSGPPVQLEGGQESSWLVGDLVLKPLDQSEEMLAWQAELLGSIRCGGFRVARPRRALDGGFVVGGWCAWERLAGRLVQRRWAEIIAVGERFHTALAGVARPAFIAQRADPWAIGDRVAWGELPIDEFAHVTHLPRLTAALRPIEARSQLIHGDLTGNVLFAEGLPPAIIDLAPYWRPPAFAAAIVVADALVWEGADERLFAAIAHIDRFEQFLLRALIYRAITDRLFREHEPVRSDHADPYLPAVELACGLAEARGVMAHSKQLTVEEVSIRRLTERDLEHLFDHRTRHFGERWLRRQRRSEVYIAVADVGGLPVGRIGLDFARGSEDRVAYLWSAHVEPVWQSRGIGTLLIRHLEEQARARDVETVRLAVGKDNTRALAFYERHGYAVVGEDVERWSYRDGDRTVEVAEDCWAMEKRLASAG